MVYSRCSVGGQVLNQIIVRCSDPNAICESRKVQQGEPHDVFIKVVLNVSICMPFYSKLKQFSCDFRCNNSRCCFNVFITFANIITYLIFDTCMLLLLYVGCLWFVS